MKKRKCPFCNTIAAGGIHIYGCAKKNNILLSRKQIKYEFLKVNFPEISDKNVLYDEYFIKKQSLPTIRSQYGIDFKSIQWLLRYFNIDIRNSAEGCLLGAKKTKQTLYNKYGVTNVSQLLEVKQKRANTCIERFGVDNIRKTKEYHIKLEKLFNKKYGLTVNELRSKRGKEYWNKLTDEQKYLWLSKSIHSDESFKKILSNRKGYNHSKLETRIENVLKEMGIIYFTQYCLKERQKRKFYDFLIEELNIIIEVNGDYWHANPLQYKRGDIINYCFGQLTAGEIWERDKDKKMLAEIRGYTVIYIWESELSTLQDNIEIASLIQSKIKNYEN